MLPQDDLGDTKVLAALLGISETVAGLSDLEEVLGLIVRITPQLVGVDRCAILMYDERRQEFRTAQVFGPDRERNAVFQRLAIREEDVRKLAHRILEQKLPALIRAASLPSNMAESLGMKMVLIVPLVCRERVLGIMTLDHTKGLGLFTSREINVVVAIAQQAAIAIDHARLKAEAARAQERLEAACGLFVSGLMTLTGDGRVLSLDSRAEALLEWKTEEVAGRGADEAFALTDRDGVRPPPIVSSDLVLRGEREPLVVSFRRKDGVRLLIEIRTAPLRDEMGEIVEVVCTLRRAPPRRGDIGEPLAVPRRIANAPPSG
jgi:PAS domain-containing protein